MEWLDEYDQNYVDALKFYHGIEREKDFGKTFEILKQNAKRGHQKSEIELACLHFLGEGTTRNWKKAKLMFTKYSQASSSALFALGVMNFLGNRKDGIKRDFHKARRFWESASSLGCEFSKRALLLSKGVENETQLYLSKAGVSFWKKIEDTTTTSQVQIHAIKDQMKTLEKTVDAVKFTLDELAGKIEGMHTFFTDDDGLLSKLKHMKYPKSSKKRRKRRGIPTGSIPHAVNPSDVLHHLSGSREYSNSARRASPKASPPASPGDPPRPRRPSTSTGLGRKSVDDHSAEQHTSGGGGGGDHHHHAGGAGLGNSYASSVNEGGGRERRAEMGEYQPRLAEYRRRKKKKKGVFEEFRFGSSRKRKSYNDRAKHIVPVEIPILKKKNFSSLLLNRELKKFSRVSGGKKATGGSARKAQ